MRNQGLIKLIILIIVAVVILSYFGFDLKSILTSDLIKNNFGFLWDGLKTIWNSYLSEPANFVWGIFYDNLWLTFLESMNR